jgi:hypothetical protein
MHAVVVQGKADPARQDEARKRLEDVVVPQAKARPGFVRGTWLRSLDTGEGIGVVLVESEDQARQAVEEIRTQGPPPDASFTLQSVAAYEVVAEA